MAVFCGTIHLLITKLRSHVFGLGRHQSTQDIDDHTLVCRHLMVRSSCGSGWYHCRSSNKNLNASKPSEYSAPDRAKIVGMTSWMFLELFLNRKSLYRAGSST